MGSGREFLRLFITLRVRVAATRISPRRMQAANARKPTSFTLTTTTYVHGSLRKLTTILLTRKERKSPAERISLVHGVPRV